MAFSLVQHKIAISAGAGATLTCTLDATPTSGNLLVAIYEVPEGAAEITPDTVTDWTRQVQAINTGDIGYSAALYDRIADGVVNSITVTHTGVNRERKITLMEFSGQAASNPFDTAFDNFSVPSLNQTAASVTSAAAPSVDNMLYVGWIGWRDASTTHSSVTSGWTEVGAETITPSGGTGNTSLRSTVYYDITANAVADGARTLASTLSTGERLGVGIVGYKPAAGGTETANAAPVTATFTVASVTATYAAILTASASPVVATYSVPSTTATYVYVVSASASPVVATFSVAATTATYVQVETASVDPVSATFTVPSVSATYIQVGTADASPVASTFSVTATTATYAAVLSASASPVSATFTVPEVTATSEGGEEEPAIPPSAPISAGGKTRIPKKAVKRRSSINLLGVG